MDTMISKQEITRRKNKTFIWIGFVVLLLILAIALLRNSIQSSLDASQITTAVVEIGSIENTLNASGEVSAEFEEVVTSPINASIKKVFLDAGTHVKTGQAIMSLDKEATETDYEKLKFQLEQKRNNIEKMKLELDKSFFDIQSNNDIKQLKISSLESAVEDAKRLFKAGGGTEESIEQAELSLKVALLEKKQLENEIRSKQKTMRMEIKETELAAAIQAADMNELGRKLQQANITAGRDGVITWVNKNIGTSVAPGESLVRIADLGSYKVTGSISDAYMDQVKIGMPVILKINETSIRGSVTNIHPSVQNGIVLFDVSISDNNNAALRPNMKVDLYLVTSTKNNVMRVANGPAFKGTVTQDVFILNNGTAVKRTVQTGLSNFDYVELLNNVKPGDVIITSDMSEYKNVKEIKVKNAGNNQKTAYTSISTFDLVFSRI